MCGICGIMGAGPGRPETPEMVRAMSRAIAHRGPDGEGFWDTPHGTLGHRRLAIIDVAGGAQPIFNEDRTVGVVLNGEIYNYADLRSDLIGRGHRFETKSDTEVLAHGYEEWGEDFLVRLRGMFAFALWDARARRLYLVRDRLGIKPLYFWVDPTSGQVSFASEIKGLLPNPDVPRAVNGPRLAEYLLFRYIAGAETLFAGVRELEPGTFARLDAEGLELRRYWSPSAATHSEAFPAAVAQGRMLVQDAVRSHLVSEVPLGTITSGGLDSSLVSAIAAGATDGPIDTFCLGFEDPSLDERPFAREVARRIGSAHHETVLTAGAFAAHLDGLTWMHDEPLSHPNAVAMHQVFHQARREAGITVLLSGEGADEVFGGYGWYRAAYRRDRLRTWLGSELAAFLMRLILRGNVRDVGGPDYLLLANALGRDPRISGLLDVREAVARRKKEFGNLCQDTEGLFRYDQLTYLQPLLQRQDRMSMAVGLEARVPFLDHPLVEWANDLRAGVKLGSGKPKHLLRHIATNFLPREIIDRRKVGFALPLGAWLRGPLRARLATIRDPGNLVSSLLPGAIVTQSLDDLDRGSESGTALLWSLLALSVWQENFLGPSTASRIPAVQAAGA